MFARYSKAMLSKLMPRNEKFGELFAEQARNAHAAAQALEALLGASGDLSTHVAKLRDLEHEGDRLSAALTQTLADSFIVPFDREDIIELNEVLDNLTDYIEEAGSKLASYNIPVQPAMQQLARVVSQQCEALSRALPMLEDKARVGDLQTITQQVRKLEDDADSLSEEAQARLYDGVTQVPQMIQAMRSGEVLQLLEDASDQAQRVAKVVENILLKNA